MRSTRPAILICALTTAATVALTGPAASASGLSTPRSPGQQAAIRATVIYPDLRLPNGQHALVYSDGLATRDGTLLTLGGGPYEHPAVDSAHAEFAVQEFAGPDFYAATPDNNALSSVIVGNEDGTGIRRIERFNFFNVFLLDFGGYVQLNPATRTAYTIGPGGTGLFPFSY